MSGHVPGPEEYDPPPRPAPDPSPWPPAAPDGTYAPDDTIAPGGGWGPDGTYAPGGAYTPEGSYAPDGTQGPDGALGPDGSYAPGGQGGAYTPGGAYAPGSPYPQDGTIAPGGGYAPNSEGGAYAPDAQGDGHAQGGPYVPGGAYAPGYDQSSGYAHDPGYGAAAGEPQRSAYVPESMAAQLPPEAEHGAAFGVPSAGDAWAADHAGAPGGQGPYAGPGSAEGWTRAPGAAAQWGAGGAQGTPAHGYDPYAGTPDALEHTAVMPAWTDEPAAGAAPPPYGGELPAQAERPPGGGPAAVPEAPAARTGSPIVPPGIQPAALTAALGLLAAGGAALGRPALAVVLLALEALTAAGWFRLNGMWPARQGIVLAFLGGVTADVALLAADGGHATEVLLGTLGVWLLLVLVLQMRHHGSPDERLSSLTATSVSALLTVVAAAWLATDVSGPGSDPVVVGAVAVAAAALVRGAALRAPGGEAVSLVPALLAAAATGAATGPATGYGTGHALELAAACGAAALVGLRVASYDFPSRFVHFTAGVALPLTAAAPVVYALGTALG